MTTGKTIALTRWTFVGKVMSLLFNMLSRLVITFLPSSKHLLISWLQSPSAVILEPPKIKSVTVSTVSPSICHEVMGPDAMILVVWLYPTLNKPPFPKNCISSSYLSSSLTLSFLWETSALFLESRKGLTDKREQGNKWYSRLFLVGKHTGFTAFCGTWDLKLRSECVCYMLMYCAHTLPINTSQGSLPGRQGTSPKHLKGILFW